MATKITRRWLQGLEQAARHGCPLSRRQAQSFGQDSLGSFVHAEMIPLLLGPPDHRTCADQGGFCSGGTPGSSQAGRRSPILSRLSRARSSDARSAFPARVAPRLHLDWRRQAVIAASFSGGMTESFSGFSTAPRRYRSRSEGLIQQGPCRLRADAPPFAAGRPRLRDAEGPASRLDRAGSREARRSRGPFRGPDRRGPQRPAEAMAQANPDHLDARRAFRS